MIAIIGMCMIVKTAGAVIQKMCGYDQDDCRNQQPDFVGNKKLFYYQQCHTGAEQQQRQFAMMMPAITMIQGVGPDTKSQQYHTGFKKSVVDDVNAKQRKTRQKQRQQGAMYRAGDRGGDPPCIPVYFPDSFLHKKQKYKKATLLQNFNRVLI